MHQKGKGLERFPKKIVLCREREKRNRPPSQTGTSPNSKPEDHGPSFFWGEEKGAWKCDPVSGVT